MNTPQILVAGGTGTNGRELLKQLADRKILTRALVREPARAADLAGPHIEMIQGDLSDSTTLAKAFEGIKKAYIVTSIHSDTTSWFDNFYAAAAVAGVDHLIKFSGYGADSTSSIEIFRQHGLSDQKLIESGLNYTILRPNSFYQNMLWQADAIKSAAQFYLPLGSARQSLVDVRDIAEVTVRILTEEGHEKQTYNLTGPQPLSFHDVADSLSKTLHKSVTYVPVGIDAAKTSMQQSGMDDWLSQALADIQGAFATGMYSSVEPDLESILGRRARSFDDFARDHAQMFG